MIMEDINILNRDPNALDGEGNTALHNYTKTGHFDPAIMISLLNRGTDLKIRNRAGQTAFLLAVIQRKKQMTQMFIAYEADVNTKDNTGNNALHYLADPELNEKYENIDSLNTDTDRKTSYLDDTYEILKELIKEGVKVNSMNRHHETPLMWAARGHHTKIVKILLENGADVHLQNQDLETCLHYALRFILTDFNPHEKMHLTIMSDLIRNKACVNCFDFSNRSALGKIIFSYHPKKVNVASDLIKIASLANWKRKIEFNLSSVIDLYTDSQMKLLVSSCYYEIGRLKNHLLPGGYNLCHFALTEATEPSLSTIYDSVLEILRTNKFPIYHDLILSHFQRSYLLRKVSDLVIYTIAENKVSLNPDVILHLSSFLENNDVLNLIHAFHSSAC